MHCLFATVFFFGDPHINTLDGKNYTFNGLGEYTMTRTMNDALVLQARTKVAQGGLNTATIFSAGAAKEANTSKVEVRLKDGGNEWTNERMNERMNEWINFI